MPLLKVEADKLSNNQLERGVIEEVIERDELFALFPFMRVNSKAYVYNRENGLSGAAFLDPNEEVPESAATFTPITVTLKIIAGDVDVDKFIQATESDTNDQKAVQIAAKSKALNRLFKQTLVSGDATANPKQFDGLSKLVTAGQTMDAAPNGGALTLSMLDQLYDMVLTGADAFFMRAGTIRAYRALVRATGGTDATQVMIKDFGMVMAHNGTPLLRNDFLPGNETLGTGNNLCSVYAARFNESDGLHAIYGGDNAGIVVEDIGTVQNKDATRTRLKWYTATALKSTKSLARLRGITNI
ncbi:major capsid protein [Cupriavidus metallidurans]|uniref:major capsid protein n=1 Tax=Cupriavidus metallidurans TaxID=119219 RepID=UPI001CCCAC6A|nr:hypothetical protein [Cupriavidus metallidurans]UBM12765.1 hypothetical protein LAI70_27825 [Cupriavidus metallidurans]